MELDAIHSMMAKGDQAEETAVMTRSSIVAIKKSTFGGQRRRKTQ